VLAAAALCTDSLRNPSHHEHSTRNATEDNINRTEQKEAEETERPEKTSKQNFLPSKLTHVSDSINLQVWLPIDVNAISEIRRNIASAEPRDELRH